jgi:hypothetical protein
MVQLAREAGNIDAKVIDTRELLSRRKATTHAM